MIKIYFKISDKTEQRFSVIFPFPWTQLRSILYRTVFFTRHSNVSRHCFRYFTSQHPTPSTPSLHHKDKNVTALKFPQLQNFPLISIKI